ncbi:MAG: hypothetical protein ACOYIG_05890 [Acetivibrionales bacterium]|jgi:hypothetical protein|nr:hypothetical protein [Anaerohalosphaeraceae bacterium]HRT52305.1 hypothetical protein [Anaerohalosphaeraceae bacterium]HRT88426.1 hypothetical protein [Anaerohalosphaeraceae bacterium]
MSKQQAEIKVCVCHWLGELVDEAVSVAGFVRRERSLAYRRATEDATQEIDVAIEHHPTEEHNAAAVIYPYYTVVMGKVNKTVKAMTGGDPQLGGNFDITLHGPIEWTSPKGLGARWYIYQPDSVHSAVSSMRDFIVKWTLPFLDRFRLHTDLCNALLEGDNPDIHGMEILRVVAARVLCGQYAEAVTIMEQWFGKPGPRKRYQQVFDYLTER